YSRRLRSQDVALLVLKLAGGGVVWNGFRRLAPRRRKTDISYVRYQYPARSVSAAASSEVTWPQPRRPQSRGQQSRKPKALKPAWPNTRQKSTPECARRNTRSPPGKSPSS